MFNQNSVQFVSDLVGNTKTGFVMTQLNLIVRISCQCFGRSFGNSVHEYCTLVFQDSEVKYTK